MMRQTGGSLVGDTSTRSRPASLAFPIAIYLSTIPCCSLFSSIRRTLSALMAVLIRNSFLLILYHLSFLENIKIFLQSSYLKLYSFIGNLFLCQFNKLFYFDSFIFLNPSCPYIYSITLSFFWPYDSH